MQIWSFRAQWLSCSGHIINPGGLFWYISICTVLGNFPVNLNFPCLVVLEEIFKCPSLFFFFFFFFWFLWLSSFRRGHDSLESPVYLRISIKFDLLVHEKIFKYFHYHPSLEMDIGFMWTNLNPLPQNDSCLFWSRLVQCIWVSPNYKNYLLRKKCDQKKTHLKFQVRKARNINYCPVKY
jgi:hypothetical protein